MLKSRNRSLTLLSVALIIISIGLFIPGMMINGLNGVSGWLLVTAFVLLIGIAIVLTVVVARSAISTATKPSSVRRAVQRTGEFGLPTTAAESDLSAQLFSDTAGELRTSVGAIQEELEDIMDDEAPADKEHMQSLFDETDRLKKIIEGMEQFSQAQALAHSLRKQSVDLGPLLNTIVEKTRLGAQGKNITISLECEPSLTIATDPDCLSKILENLMDNAAKAVKSSGSVTLAVAQAGDQMVFSVRDTGTGIRPKQLPHLYERFFRGAGSGIGMGLAITKELVDACGGKIEVKTKSGEGSVFTVHIPAA
jgi:two-component system sensor histidine kinase BaeS